MIICTSHRSYNNRENISKLFETHCWLDHLLLSIAGMSVSSTKDTLLGLTLTLFCVFGVRADNWNRHLQLDPNGIYHLYWNISGEKAVFQVEVKTSGWVGFGISPNGGMSGSDVVIGWVSNGITTFHDRHAVGENMPIIDQRQDWTLMRSNENETHTVLQFQRKLETCDDEDLPIKGYSVRVIYCYGLEDPQSEDNVQYHGPFQRGTKSVNILNNENPSINLSPEDLFYWDIRSANASVPSDVDTAYYCTVVKRPQFEELHHIIKVEPVIQRGHERFVHHMLLSECTDANEEQLEPLLKGYHECYTEDRVPKFTFCFTTTTVWAVGGEDLYLPEHVGLPIGRPNGVYYILEVHYDNPGFVKGIVDNSGLKITLTPKLRKHDAGVVAFGNLWYPCMFIPPRQKEFVISGHAHPSCLSQSLPADGIKVFGTLLHTHVTGKKIKVRHFRGEEELPPIGSDDNYDFNYQNIVTLPKEREILPKDHIIIECTYNTTERQETTFGGLSTREEMCLTFLYYYPEVQLSLATSCPAPINVVKMLGVTEMSDDDRYLISPITGSNESYIDFLNTYPWDDNSVNAIQRTMKYSPQLNMCTDRGGKVKLVFHLSRYPKITKAYEEPDKCAGRRSQEDNDPLLSNEGPIPQTLPQSVWEVEDE